MKSLVIRAIIIGCAIALLYSKVLYSLVIQWADDPDYSHGFLVPLISAYLVWERWQKLARTPWRPSPWGVGVLGLGLLMLLIGSIGAELYLQRSSLLVVMAGLVLLILGREHLQLLSFPLAFLLFMVPLPAIVINAVAFPLQLLAAQTATLCLFNLGIPVLREGNVIMLAGTTLEVAEACSGIRSLQALVALGTVYAYFSQRESWKRWALVAISIPIAILANAFRVTGTGILAHYWGNQAAEGFYHTFSGLAVFLAALMLLLVSGAIISRIGRGRRGRQVSELLPPQPLLTKEGKLARTSRILPPHPLLTKEGKEKETPL